MGLDVKQLHTWYESVRSKIGKLTDRKSGSATKELSDRDKYLLDKFGFLKDHIVRQPSRVGSSLKSKLLALQPQSQATATATCSGSDEELPDTQTLQQTQPQPSARPPPKSKGKCKSREGEDQMMATFREQQQQNAKLQGSIAGLLDPVRQSAPASWGSWVGTMAESFDRSLLPQFYMDSFNLVMRYQNESRQLGQPQQPAFVPQQVQQPQPQQPAFVPQQQPAFSQVMARCTSLHRRSYSNSSNSSYRDVTAAMLWTGTPLALQLVVLVVLPARQRR